MFKSTIQFIIICIVVFITLSIITYVNKNYVSFKNIPATFSEAEIYDYFIDDHYAVILAHNDPGSLKIIVLNRAIFNIFEIEPIFISEPSVNAYNSIDINSIINTKNSPKIHVEFGISDIASKIEIIYNNYFANTLLYENGFFFRVLDEENDPFKHLRGGYDAHEIRLLNSDGRFIESIALSF